MTLPGLNGLPVIDRDEARYAQASLQMAESGDWINIRFQDEARNKKPAGAYWVQTAMLKAFSSPEKRQIWVQRIPSVIAGLLAIWLTYLGGIRLIGRHGAFYGAGAMALSLIFVFEAHIAKTDALLCATSCGLFAAFAHLRHPREDSRFKNTWKNIWVWVFWISIGAGIMIKGPIVPTLAIITIAGLWIWERQIGWARALLYWPAILVFFLIWVPWVIAIWNATDGAFFAESLGKDFGGKLVSVQEKHPGPPGYHLALISLTLWPACLFLVPGLSYAILSVRRGKKDQSAVTKAMRLCLIWVIPFWLMIEIMPTKLPHYSLPLFPALCVMIGAAIITLLQVKAFVKSRFISGLLFLIAGTGLIAALLFGATRYGPDTIELPTYIITALGGCAVLCASFALWIGWMKTSLISGACAGVVLSVGAYGYILPNLTDLRLSERIAGELRLKDYSQLVSVSFTEPSLVYHTDKSVQLGGKVNPLDVDALKAGRILLLDMESEDDITLKDALLAATTQAQLCMNDDPVVDGFNYSKGKDVRIVKITANPCPELTAPEQPTQPSE